MEIQPLTIMTTTDDEILKPQVEKKKLELSLDLDLDTHHHQSRIGSAVISQPPTPAPVLKHQSMSAPSSPVKQSQFNARMKHSWLDQLRELIPSAQDLQKSEKKQEPSPPRQPPLGARRRSLSDSSLLLVSQRNNKNDNHQLELSQILSPEPGSPASRALMKANSDFRTKHKIRHKRMRIGKKKLGRTNYRRPKGAEINAQHEQYALTYGMMSGILNSVGAQNPFKLRLSMNDFMRVDKRTFASNNGKLENPFKFKDYSPDIFRQIRRRFSIDSADYMLTLCGDFNYIEFISNSKSGQFFFYSHDGRFMIKTQTKAESKFLRRILPHYYKFAMENPNTLVTKFYGMHRVKMHHLRRKMHFVIMASVFDTPKEIHQRFDLKVSLVVISGTYLHISDDASSRLSRDRSSDARLLRKNARIQAACSKIWIYSKPKPACVSDRPNARCCSSSCEKTWPFSNSSRSWTIVYSWAFTTQRRSLSRMMIRI